jgi:hypothetical protein
VFIPVTYTESMIDYYAEYFNTINYSFPLVENNKPIGFWPGLIRNQIYPPIFETGVSDKVQRKQIEMILKTIDDNKLRNHKIVDFSFGEVSVWHHVLLELGIKFEVNYYHYINFNKDLKIRKSYKNLNNQYHNKYPTTISHDSSLIIPFRQKHIEVAGRETRSIETWNKQAESVSRGEGFIVYIKDLAYSLFNYSKDECLYAVAAYDRNEDAPLGHLTLIAAINYARDVLKCQGFNLGDAVFAEDLKNQHISYFKSGFANEMRPKFIGAFKNEE